MFIKHFFLYSGVDSPSVGLAVHFSFILYKRNSKRYSRYQTDDRWSAGQEIPDFYGMQELIDYYVHKIPRLGPGLGRQSTLHTANFIIQNVVNPNQ